MARGSSSYWLWYLLGLLRRGSLLEEVSKILCSWGRARGGVRDFCGPSAAPLWYSALVQSWSFRLFPDKTASVPASLMDEDRPFCAAELCAVDHWLINKGAQRVA